MLTAVAFAAMILSVVVGLVMLAGLMRSGRRLPGFVPVHLGLALASLSGWTAYALQEDRPTWLAWTVFLLVFATNTFGDQLMLQAWRAGAGRDGSPVPTGARAYLAAAVDLLSFKRPVPAIHALLAPVSFFSVLLVTLGVGG
jgi:hypothetical protein